MCGCSTRWMCWVFSVLWLPGSVPADLLAQGCCHARPSVVLVTIPVVPGQLRGMTKASGPSAPLARWQRVPCRAGQPPLALLFPSFCRIGLPGSSTFSVCGRRPEPAAGLGHGYRAAVLGHPTPNEPHFWPFSSQKSSNPFHDFCITI